MKDYGKVKREDIIDFKEGWVVQITRKDGTSFMASGAMGDIPPIWAKRNRSRAAEFARDLKIHGFKAKVYSVLYTLPTYGRKTR